MHLLRLTDRNPIVRTVSQNSHDQSGSVMRASQISSKPPKKPQDRQIRHLAALAKPVSVLGFRRLERSSLACCRRLIGMDIQPC
jgi:hypothetical protein